MKRLALWLIFCLSVITLHAQNPEFTFVFLNKKADKAFLPEDEVKKIMDGHMANIQRLAKEGKLVAAGPFDGGGGIFIFKSGSVDEVKQWLETDPGVKAKRWNVEILPYHPQFGSVCAVGEPYEMVTYQFIRYSKISDTNSKYIKKHKQYLTSLRKGNKLVTEASFNETEGILIVNGNLTESTINTDPAIVKGLLKAEILKLWIAKGSFCEK